MKTYKNDFSKTEDETLWEIHEIRHSVHKNISPDNLSKFNEKARTMFDIRKKSKKETKII